MYVVTQTENGVVYDVCWYTRFADAVARVKRCRSHATPGVAYGVRRG